MGFNSSYMSPEFADIQTKILAEHVPERKFPSIDESHLYPMSPLVTSKKPDTKVYITLGRHNGKTMYQYEYIKAMLDAGYEFVPVEECESHATFLVRPGKKEK